MKRMFLLLLIGLALMITGHHWYSPMDYVVASAAQAYRQGDYDRALKQYQQAIRHGGNTAALEHNRAAACYRLQNFGEAKQGFQRAQEAGLDAAREAYNRGNCFLSQASQTPKLDPQLLTETVEQYRSCLQQEASTSAAGTLFADARHNLELAKLLLTPGAASAQPSLAAPDSPPTSGDEATVVAKPNATPDASVGQAKPSTEQSDTAQANPSPENSDAHAQAKQSTTGDTGRPNDVCSHPSSPSSADPSSADKQPLQDAVASAKPQIEDLCPTWRKQQQEAGSASKNQGQAQANPPSTDNSTKDSSKQGEGPSASPGAKGSASKQAQVNPQSTANAAKDGSKQGGSQSSSGDAKDSPSRPSEGNSASEQVAKNSDSQDKSNTPTSKSKGPTWSKCGKGAGSAPTSESGSNGKGSESASGEGDLGKTLGQAKGPGPDGNTESEGKGKSGQGSKPNPQGNVPGGNQMRAGATPQSVGPGSKPLPQGTSSEKMIGPDGVAYQPEGQAGSANVSQQSSKVGTAPGSGSAGQTGAVAPQQNVEQDQKKPSPPPALLNQLFRPDSARDAATSNQGNVAGGDKPQAGRQFGRNDKAKQDEEAEKRMNPMERAAAERLKQVIQRIQRRRDMHPITPLPGPNARNHPDRQRDW